MADRWESVTLACFIPRLLNLCGISIDDPDGALYDAMIGISNHQLSKEDLMRLLERLAQRLQ
jgi:hypothetical protein